eukprot:scaffold50389_cov69-Phaeocystis_antarctica.AAC.8
MAPTRHQLRRPRVLDLLLDVLLPVDRQAREPCKSAHGRRQVGQDADGPHADPALRLCVGRQYRVVVHHVGSELPAGNATRQVRVERTRGVVQVAPHRRDGLLGPRGVQLEPRLELLEPVERGVLGRPDPAAHGPVALVEKRLGDERLDAVLARHLKVVGHALKEHVACEAQEDHRATRQLERQELPHEVEQSAAAERHDRVLNGIHPVGACAAVRGGLAQRGEVERLRAGGRAGHHVLSGDRGAATLDGVHEVVERRQLALGGGGLGLAQQLHRGRGRRRQHAARHEAAVLAAECLEAVVKPSHGVDLLAVLLEELGDLLVRQTEQHALVARHVLRLRQASLPSQRPDGVGQGGLGPVVVLPRDGHPGHVGQQAQRAERVVRRQDQVGRVRLAQNALPGDNLLFLVVLLLLAAVGLISHSEIELRDRAPFLRLVVGVQLVFAQLQHLLDRLKALRDRPRLARVDARQSPHLHVARGVRQQPLSSAHLGPADRLGMATRRQRGLGRLHVAHHADGDRVAAGELPFLHGVEELGGAQPLPKGDDGVAARRHRLGGLREGLEVEARLLNARAGHHVLLGQRGEVARKLLPAVSRVPRHVVQRLLRQLLQRRLQATQVGRDALEGLARQLVQLELGLVLREDAAGRVVVHPKEDRRLVVAASLVRPVPAILLPWDREVGHLGHRAQRAQRVGRQPHKRHVLIHPDPRLLHVARVVLE